MDVVLSSTFGSPVTVTFTGISRVLTVGSLVLKATIAFLLPATRSEALTVKVRFVALPTLTVPCVGVTASHFDPVASTTLSKFSRPLATILPLNASIGSAEFMRIFFIS